MGGFGEIYLASNDTEGPVGSDADYVIKVEPHSNGPLFAEMHCYMRLARPEHIEGWKKENRLKRLGMPKFFGSGSFEYNNQKYRFMVMERFGQDLQKILEQHSKRLSFKTVYQVGIQIVSGSFHTFLLYIFVPSYICSITSLQLSSVFSCSFVGYCYPDYLIGRFDIKNIK